MNDIGPVTRFWLAAGSGPARVNHGEDHASAPGRAADRVELSDQARRLSTASQVPTVRQEQIQRVRAEINANRYETPEKIDIAAERLLSSLTAESR